MFLDCPPVLPVTDSLVLSRSVDATLFVAMGGRTSRREAEQSIERLRQVRSPLIGSILNGVSAEGTYDSMYAYHGIVKESRTPVLARLPVVGRAFGKRRTATPAAPPYAPPQTNGSHPRPTMHTGSPVQRPR